MTGGVGSETMIPVGGLRSRVASLGGWVMSSARTAIVRVFLPAVLLGVMLSPVAAFAQEVALTIGRVVGDDVLDAVDDGVGLGFGDAGIYGARVSLGAILLKVEGRFSTARSICLSTPPRNSAPASRTPRSPWPSIWFPARSVPSWRAASGITESRSMWSMRTITPRWGYNVGVGMKIGLGAVAVRVDVRDHITPLKIDANRS